MRLYLKAHKWIEIATFSSTAAFIAGMLVHVEIRLPPSLTFSVPMAVFAGMVPSILIASGSRRVAGARSLAVTRLGYWESITPVAASALTAISYLLGAYISGDTSTQFVALRNFAGLLGLAYLSLALFGPGLFWLLPTAFFATAIVAGVGQDNAAYAWAWPIQDANPGALCAGILTCCIGATALLISRGTARDSSKSRGR